MVINQFPFGLSPKQYTKQFGLCQGTADPHRCEMVGGFYRCTLKIEYVVPVRSIYFFCTVVGLRSRWDATAPAIKYNPHRQKPPSRDAGSGESGRTPAARNINNIETRFSDFQIGLTAVTIWVAAVCAL